MTLTLEPLDGPQYVTERATDAPVVPVFKPRETLDCVMARHYITYAEARAIYGLPPAEYTGPLRRKNRDALGRGA